jgi:LPS export ABC transporter permease LptF/LPS export ABC transporter permease LptG
MKILRRYLIREMIGPTLLGFGFYTFIILMRSLFDFAEMIIKRSLPLNSVFKLLGLSLPHIVVLTIPMSLLFGILIAVGRLSSDSEIIAMRAAGLSMNRIYRPVLYFSFVVFLLNLYLMNFVLPWGNTALQDLRAEIFTASVERELQPRVFYDEWENYVIYVDEVEPETGTWRGVFVSDASDPKSQRVVFAQTGSISRSDDGKQLWLNLQNARTHAFSPEKPDRYELSTNGMLRFLLLDRFAEEDDLRAAAKSYRAMTLSELMREARRPNLPIDRNVIWVEIHKKFAFPFACLSFSALALPLGISNRRGGKSSGFSLSILIILAYYVVIRSGEDMARTGELNPALAMWLPNVILIVTGLWLMRRANTDVGTSGKRTIFQRIMRRITRIGRKRSTVVTDGPGLLSRLDLAFPNLLDRYILRQFIYVLGLVLISTIVMFVVVDYSDLSGDIAENRIKFPLVASYYRYFAINALSLTLPLSVLLGTLITFGLLARNNEVTALKANGVSLYRVTLPIVIVAALISGVTYLLQDFVLPYSNQRMAELRRIIKGRVAPRSFSVPQQQWLFGQGRYLYNFLSYDQGRRTLSRVQVLELHPTAFQLARRVAAAEARFDGVGWVFVNGWIRSFGDDGAVSFTPIVQPVRLHYPERPEYFSTDVRRPEQMTYVELRRYIQKLRTSGYSANELLVELYKKTSWPFISLVMSLIALPFSFRIGKRGALYGIGIALFLAFVYWTVFGIFTKFGEVGNLPAILSAWSANVLFAIAAVYMFLRVET